MTRASRAVFSPLFLLPLAGSPAFALGFAKTELDKTRVASNEAVILTITHPSDCEVAPPRSPQFEVLKTNTEFVQGGMAGRRLEKVSSNYSPQSSQSSLKSFGGGSGQKKTIFQIHPLVAGKVAIEPLTIACPDGKIQSARKEFSVTAAVVAGSHQAQQNPDDMLYKPVSLGGPAPAQEAPPPPVEQADPQQPEPAQPPPPDRATWLSQPPPAAPAPATGSSDAVAKKVTGIAEKSAEMAEKQHAAINRAGKAIGILILRIALWLAGAAAAVFLGVVGFRRFQRTPHYEALWLWMRSQTSKEKIDPTLIGGKYKVLTELGAGGMGTVLLAQDTKLGRKVALKKLHSDDRFSMKNRQKIRDEAKLISQLNHPYIVNIHEMLEQDEDIYLAFDYVEGKPLSHVLAEQKRLPLAKCVEIFGQVCQAVDYAHKKNVLHLDIKPSNIMLDGSGYAKLMDFGLARREARADGFATVGGSGTFWYMAPEQHADVPYPVSDVYSLGVTLYEALTGDIPFRGPDFLRQKEFLMYNAPTKLAPELPAAVDQLIADALAPAMQKRIQTPLEFLERLKAAAAAPLAGPAAAPSSAAPPASSPASTPAFPPAVPPAAPPGSGAAPPAFGMPPAGSTK